MFSDDDCLYDEDSGNDSPEDEMEDEQEEMDDGEADDFGIVTHFCVIPETIECYIECHMDNLSHFLVILISSQLTQCINNWLGNLETKTIHATRFHN